MFLLTEDSPSHIQLETTQVWLAHGVNVMDQVTEFTSTYPHTKLGGGLKYVLFSPLFGEDSHFDKYFSNGLKPPTRKRRGQVEHRRSIVQGWLNSSCHH